MMNPHLNSDKQAVSIIGWKPVTDYEATRYAFIKAGEGLGFPIDPNNPTDLFDLYVDSDGIATIGVGFNLQGDSLREEILNEIYGTNPISSTIQTSLTSILVQNYGSSQTRAQQVEKTRILREAVENALASLRTQHPKITIPAFRFDDEGHIEQFFNDNPAAASSYELRLTNHLTKNGVNDVPMNTEERIALLSLLWNAGEGIIGKNLCTALEMGDRLSAWYEIRYQSNRDKIYAGRRAAEAELFGLYDIVPSGALSVDEAYARRIGELHYRYEDIIRPYDQTPKYQKGFLEAAKTYHMRIPLSFTEAAQPAIEFLMRNHAWIQTFGGVQTYVIHRPEPRQLFAVLPEEAVKGEGVVDHSKSNYDVPKLTDSPLNNDLLLGAKDHPNLLTDDRGNDLLIGGDLEDTLVGGRGRDVLISGGGINILNGGDGDDVLLSEGSNDQADGGKGSDRYVRVVSFPYTGQLHVHDSDGQGVTVFGHDATAFEQFSSNQGDAVPVYDAQGNPQYYLLYRGPGDTFSSTITCLILRKGSTLELFEVGSDVIPTDIFTHPADILIDGWSEQNNYGINLLDLNVDCPGLDPFVGCKRLVLGDALGTDFGDLGKGAASLYADPAGSATGGDDIAMLGSGNDEAYMGPGNDIAYGGEGNDLLVGNTGNDRLYGGPGDDVVEDIQNIFTGEGGAEEQGTQPDILQGDAGDDALSAYGSYNQLSGGAGNDVLIIQYGALTVDASNNVLDGGPSDDTLKVDRANATLIGGEGFQAYDISLATLQEGYTVIIKGAKLADPSTMETGMLLIDGTAVEDIKLDPNVMGTYSHNGNVLTLRLKTPVLAEGVTAVGGGTVEIENYYQGFLGVTGIPDAPLAPWDNLLSSTVYLPLINRGQTFAREQAANPAINPFSQERQEQIAYMGNAIPTGILLTGAAARRVPRMLRPIYRAFEALRVEADVVWIRAEQALIVCRSAYSSVLHRRRDDVC